MQISDLITDEYRQLNYELHQGPIKYGSFNDSRAAIHLKSIRKMMERHDCQTVLDYGCGKGDLSTIIPCTNYDPCIPKFSILPEPHDLVVCTDVLEHIEPEKLDRVLDHLDSVMNKAGYFVIATRPDKSKKLGDGSNPHKIIESHSWWFHTLKHRFSIVSAKDCPNQESIFEVTWL